MDIAIANYNFRIPTPIKKITFYILYKFHNNRNFVVNYIKRRLHAYMATFEFVLYQACTNDLLSKTTTGPQCVSNHDTAFATAAQIEPAKAALHVGYTFTTLTKGSPENRKYVVGWPLKCISNGHHLLEWPLRHVLSF